MSTGTTNGVGELGPLSDTAAGHALGIGGLVLAVAHLWKALDDRRAAQRRLHFQGLSLAFACGWGGQSAQWQPLAAGAGVVSALLLSAGTTNRRSRGRPRRRR